MLYDGMSAFRDGTGTDAYLDVELADRVLYHWYEEMKKGVFIEIDEALSEEILQAIIAKNSRHSKANPVNHPADCRNQRLRAPSEPRSEGLRNSVKTGSFTCMPHACLSRST